MVPRDPLSATFSALADPTRRAILARLLGGETAVKVLAQPFNMSAPGISKHLKVLERAGLVTRARRAQWRPCRLDAKPLRDIAAWVGSYRQFWDDNFVRPEQHLQVLQPDSKRHGRTKQ